MPLSGSPAFVAMVKTAQPLEWKSLVQLRVVALAEAVVCPSKSQVSSGPMIIIQKTLEMPVQAAFVQHDQVI
jgi:hypothetical protein